MTDPHAVASYLMPPFFAFRGASTAPLQVRSRGSVLAGALAGLVLILCGTIAWLTLSDQPIPQGTVLGLAASVTALALGFHTTHKVKALQREVESNRYALHATLLKLHAIWDKAPLSIMLLEPNDPKIRAKIIDCNPRTCEMHGYAREEIIGQSIDLLEATPWTHTQPNWVEKFRLHPHQRFEGEAQHKRKDGTLFWVEYFTGLIVIEGRDMVIGMDRAASDR